MEKGVSGYEALGFTLDSDRGKRVKISKRPYDDDGVDDEKEESQSPLKKPKLMDKETSKEPAGHERTIFELNQKIRDLEEAVKDRD